MSVPKRWEFASNEAFKEALRDYFAGQALAGLCSDRRTLDMFAESAVLGKVDVVALMAKTIYQYADAMIEERDR